MAEYILSSIFEYAIHLLSFDQLNEKDISAEWLLRFVLSMILISLEDISKICRACFSLIKAIFLLSGDQNKRYPNPDPKFVSCSAGSFEETEVI